MTTKKTKTMKLNESSGIETLKSKELSENFNLIENEFAIRGLNIFWNGADPTGTRDSTNAFTATIQEDSSNSIFIPEGIYLINQNLTINSNVRLIFDRNARLKPSLGAKITINCFIEAMPHDWIFDISDGGIFTGTSKNTIVYPQWFGALISDSDDSTSLQASIDFAYECGIGTVFLPSDTEDYDLYKPINLKKGVRLLSNGANINRKFSRTVSGWAIRLNGDNIVEGINYNGGSDSIPVDLRNNEFIYYSDILTDNASGPVWIQKNKFSNSCGTFILGNSDNVIIAENIFGNYLDHAVYFGGRNFSNVISESIVIKSNILNSNTSSREAIKVRNGAKNIVLSTNIINLPNAAFSTFDIGDSNVPAVQNQNITISQNIGYCTRFTLFLGNIESEVSNNNINITDNNFTCTDYVLIFGNLPTNETSQRSCVINNCIISGNTFKTSYRMGILNGDLIGAINLISITNNILQTGDQEVLFYLLGNIKFLNFEGNIVNSNKVQFSEKSYFDFSQNYNNNAAFFPTTNGTIRIRDNTFIGRVQSIIYDNSTGSVKKSSAIMWNLDLDGNTMISDKNKIPVNVLGEFSSAIVTKCSIRNTTYFGGTYGISKFNNKNLIDLQDTSACSVGLSSAQQIPKLIWTKVSFAHIDFDKRQNFEAPHSRFSVTQQGVYHISSAVEVSGYNQGSQFALSIYKNGSEHKRLSWTTLNGANNVMVSGTVILDLAFQDYVEIWVYSQSTVTLINNLPRTYMQLVKIN
ncbi:hypothetical protein M3647_04030 [Paenibacillus cellulositrophicus]|uniref:C1q-like domain-containing protein n=1 Tax=Paenibacillus cellulositrophicus TaxID=562959 RepID=UPI0020403E78|nr:hypothetical protein [Paenibacillus cellulositrophicus]MCM2996633.1 hypothetical protein [Paenibacillus cellulositrophicus]